MPGPLLSVAHPRSYSAMMTATTVGLGEYGPISQGARMFAVFHILVCVSFFGALVNVLMRIQDTLGSHRRKRSLLTRQLDPAMITALDVDGNGVDKLECASQPARPLAQPETRAPKPVHRSRRWTRWSQPAAPTAQPSKPAPPPPLRCRFVLGMLMQMDILTEAEFKPFMDEFDLMDKDGSGHLDHSDLEMMVQERREAAERKASGKGIDSSPFMKAIVKPMSWATLLYFPTALALLNFIWHTWYGYLLLASGALNALLIQSVLGRKPTPNGLTVSMTIAFLAVLALAASATFFLMWAPFNIPGQKTTFWVDQMAFDLTVRGGDIDGDSGLLNKWDRNAEIIQETAQRAYDHLHEHQTGFALLFIYGIYFVVTAWLDLMVALRCFQAKQLIARCGPQERALMTQWLQQPGTKSTNLFDQLVSPPLSGIDELQPDVRSL